MVDATKLKFSVGYGLDSQILSLNLPYCAGIGLFARYGQDLQIVKWNLP